MEQNVTCIPSAGSGSATTSKKKKPVASVDTLPSVKRGMQTLDEREKQEAIGGGSKEKKLLSGRIAFPAAFPDPL